VSSLVYEEKLSAGGYAPGRLDRYRYRAWKALLLAGAPLTDIVDFYEERCGAPYPAWVVFCVLRVGDARGWAGPDAGTFKYYKEAYEEWKKEKEKRC